MKRFNLRNNLNASVWIGGTILTASALAGWVDTAGYGCRSCLSPSLPALWDGSSRKRESEPTVEAAGKEAG